MKMKIAVIIGCLLLIVNNSMCQNWNKISKEIKKVQLLDQPNTKDYINCYYNLRQVSNSLKLFSSITQTDTIFLLESHGDWSSLELTSVFWNCFDTVAYNSNDGGKTYEIIKDVLFPRYMMKLVSEWNLEEIKREEEVNAHSQPQYWNFATRIIFNGKKYKIDCIYLKDFFNLERDRIIYNN